MNTRSLTTLIALTCAAALPTAHATNGYFSHGYGTKSKGMAGAGSALPQDAMIAATNVAGLAWLERRLDLGATLFSPSREYTQRSQTSGIPGNPPLPIGSNPDFTGNVESGVDLFLIPHFAYAQPISDAGTFGAALYGNGGMNSSYYAEDTSFGLGTFGSSGRSGVDLAQLALNLSYAHKITESLSLGAGVLFGYQAFTANGLGPLGQLVADGNPDALSNNGQESAFGFGAQIGALWQINEQFSFAASYQSEINFASFDDYADLFAGQGNLDAPAMLNLGLAFQPRSDLTFAFDVQHIWYSDIDALANPMTTSLERCLSGQAEYCLGGDKGAGFGWEDMTVFKFGVQYDLRPDLTLRGGYSYGEQPVPDEGVLFNVLAPAVIEQHFTLGLTKRLNDRAEISLAGMYAPSHDIDCGCRLPFTGGDESINIAMEQWELELSFGLKF